MPCPNSRRMIDVRGRIQTWFPIIGNAVSSLPSSSFANPWGLNSIQNSMGSRKQLSIFENHFHAMFINVHLCTVFYIMLQIKYVHIIQREESRKIGTVDRDSEGWHYQSFGHSLSIHTSHTNQYVQICDSQNCNRGSLILLLDFCTLDKHAFHRYALSDFSAVAIYTVRLFEIYLVSASPHPRSRVRSALSSRCSWTVSR